MNYWRQSDLLVLKEVQTTNGKGKTVTRQSDLLVLKAATTLRHMTPGDTRQSDLLVLKGEYVSKYKYLEGHPSVNRTCWY